MLILINCNTIYVRQDMVQLLCESKTFQKKLIGAGLDTSKIKQKIPNGSKDISCEVSIPQLIWCN
jgi:hypothetical protein